MNDNAQTLLSTISSPADVRALSVEQLPLVAEEIRSRIIDRVSKTGGHLASNLGVVELTLAMLRVFEPPEDKIVWDVSHQAYAYKLLTGRESQFDTIRQYKGISGFLKRSESPYDAFGAGHAGTALSSALGMAAAMDARESSRSVLAVVGDAAMGCGPTLEALNSVATTTDRMIVVLNDNEMSIDKNVGALSRCLAGMLANPAYNRWKRSVEEVAEKLRMGWMRSTYHRVEEAVKSLFLRSVLFEELGLRYIGPVDGHDVAALEDALTVARDYKRPVLLHVTTIKGKGYAYAEKNPGKWHGSSGFNIKTGDSLPSSGKNYSAVMGDTLSVLAREDPAVVAITAAMASGTGLHPFSQEFPARCYDVGIAEEHAMIFAGGLAAEGMKPVFAVYSTFVQRAVDCLIHDVALQRLPVVICLDRAGLVGDDGPTHHGVFDIPLIRAIPDLIYMQPRDAQELADMLKTAVDAELPCVLRYPRGTCPGEVGRAPAPLTIGRAELLRPGKDVAIWALGDMLPVAEEVATLLAGEGVSVAVVNPRFIRPFDRDLLEQQVSEVRLVVSIENGVICGGFGSALGEQLDEWNAHARLLKFGVPDHFVEQGPCDQLLRDCGIDRDLIAARIRETLASMEGR
jgi:1-deoxy-D-xylulose-5-phosphate synthase